MRKLLGIAAVTMTLAASANAATIVDYDTHNAAGGVAAAIEGSGVTGTDLNRGAGLVQNVGNDYNSRNWTQGGDLAAAVANQDFLTWGFTSSSAYNLTGLDIAYDRSGTGAMQIAIQASINGGAFNTIFSDLTVGTSTQIQNIALMATNVTSAVFRLAGWGSTNPLGTFDIETDEVGAGNSYGLVISGDIAPVPVPAAGVLLAGALGGLGLMRRRKKS